MWPSDLLRLSNRYPRHRPRPTVTFALQFHHLGEEQNQVTAGPILSIWRPLANAIKCFVDTAKDDTQVTRALLVRAILGPHAPTTALAREDRCSIKN